MKKMISYDLYQNNKIIEHGNNIVAELTKTTLKYIKDEIEHIISFKEDILFERKTTDYKFTLNLSKKIAYLSLIEYNVIDLKVLSSNFSQKDGEIIIDYELESSEEGSTKLHIKIGEDVNER